MKHKYVSFDYWFGGWNNIRMTFELVGAISYVTGRTIILPPKGYCLFLSEHHDKSTFFDAWNILDKKAYLSQFNCIEYEDSVLTKYSSEQQYYDGIHEDIHCVMFGDEPNNWGPQQFPGTSVIVHNIEDQNHYKEFTRDRSKEYKLPIEEEIIHFPRNLFGHAMYHVYPPNDTARRVIQQKIRDGVKLRSEFFDTSSRIMPGDYDAIHVRRNDFKYVHTDTVEKQLNELPDLLEGRVRKNKPLYIATDEKDRSLFESLRNYDLKFLSDLISTDDHTALCLDMIICSNAGTFLGSKYSTYSEYIHILRGYQNKKDFSRDGLNYKRNQIKYKKYPWEVEPYDWANPWNELYYGKI